MILITEDKYMTIQSILVKEVNDFFNIDRDYETSDYVVLEAELPVVLKYTLIGNILYLDLNKIKNKILENKELLAFFKEKHTKQEIISFCSSIN